MTNLTIEGPVSGGRHGWPFGASTQAVESLGYQEAEYFLSGRATRYRPPAGTELGADGRWQAEAAGEADYSTRVLVYRPLDPQRFNGTVILSWNNVTAGHDLFGAESAEIFESGYALACVTTQKVGIVGLPPNNQGLGKWDPDRYGGLHHPGDDYSFDIFTQAALAVGRDRDRGGIDPMAGLDVRHVVAQGSSQSAGRLAAYVNAIAPLNTVIDGFILTIYFGRGAALEVGDEVVNISTADRQSQSVADRLRGQNCLRDDLDAPVFVVNSELEAIACQPVRQPDTERMRFWEVAGTSHTSYQGRVARQKLLDRDQLVSRPIEPAMNALPMNPIYDAAYCHMHNWLTAGVAPPIGPRIEFRGEPAEIVRDEHGIAVGGIRMPQADVPLARNSAIPRTPDIYGYLGGSSEPFAKTKVLDRYGSEEAFLQQFADAAGRTQENGFILPRDVPLLVAEARAKWTERVDGGT